MPWRRCGEGILELGGAHAGGARPISCLMIIRSGHLGVAKFLDLGERSEVHLKAQTSTRGCLWVRWKARSEGRLPTLGY